MKQNKPSYIGEAAAVVAVLDFIIWIASSTPKYLLFIWVLFGLIFIIDYMLGGIADKGICKDCF
ncbi:MAG: hypothetical protein KKF89_00215 [Nanoarchaeota archaeon]|nr:hypothetical protein [Nanoarchaeota archaeon]